MSASSAHEHVELTDVQLCDIVEGTVQALREVDQALAASEADPDQSAGTEILRRRLREESGALCREATEAVARLRRRLDIDAA